MSNHELPPDKHHLQRRGCGRVSFLAVMDEVRAEVVRGVPLVQIYEAFENRLDLGYTQFTKYITRFIKQGRPVFEPRPRRTN
ncbi:TraK family protein [Pseudomonas sp. 13B_3.2_Bac1]|uniref:TraK family protein n=1 Tax=Pseudomonas sp. 13B_3.2_Bac1 TaxID=2971623 RepID=UPI0021CA1FFC|nr:TraK family protein [Pseudomonas sp. 13B_3.2_Bac1]MCU1772259.1 TraK family protein [Pseudomonas sp. 13B_3.2_Bac1]